MASLPSGEVRLLTGPVASGTPCRARIGARRPTVSRRPTRSSVASPGKVRLGFQATLPPSSGSRRIPSTLPNSLVPTSTPTSTTSLPLTLFGPSALPGSIEVAVDAPWASR